MWNRPRGVGPAHRLVRSSFLNGGSGGKTRSTTPRTWLKPPGRRPEAIARTMTVRTQLRTAPHLSDEHPCARRTLVARVTTYPRHTHPLLSDLLLSRGLSPPLSLLHPSPRPTARLLLLRPRPPAPPSPFNLRRPHVHVHCAGKAHSTMYRGFHKPHSWPPAPVSSDHLPTLRQRYPLHQPPPFQHRNASGKIAGILQAATRRRTRSALVAPPTMMSTERNFTC